MRGTTIVDNELLNAIREIFREELQSGAVRDTLREELRSGAIRDIVREEIQQELAKERQLTRAEMRELRDDLRSEMHAGFKRFDEFRLEVRSRLNSIAAALTDHDARLTAIEEANLHERLTNLEHRDDSGGNGKPD